MKLSKNFSLEELTRSNTADKHGIDNTPDDDVIDNLQELVDNVLQPIRDHYNKSVTVTSGYRCLELNNKLNSSVNSQHIKGQAAI